MKYLIIEAETRNKEILTSIVKINTIREEQMKFFINKFKTYKEKLNPKKNFITEPEIGETHIKDIFDIKNCSICLLIILNALSFVKGGYINIFSIEIVTIIKKEKLL